MYTNRRISREQAQKADLCTLLQTTLCDLSMAASSRAKEYHELPSGQTFQVMSYRQQPDRSGCGSSPYIPLLPYVR